LTVGSHIHGFSGQIQAIRIGQFEIGNPDRLASLAEETAKLLGEEMKFDERDFDLNEDYHGGSYGVMSESDRNAIRLFAEQEGIFLDPVYTGKAAGGLLDLIQRGSIPIEERVLFWHTGGGPALFAYAKELGIQKKKGFSSE
jgi:D-cysteine desulfhydrase